MKMTDWIYILDDKPKNREPVLVLKKDFDVDIGFYDESNQDPFKWQYIHDNLDSDPLEPMGWMHLPEDALLAIDACFRRKYGKPLRRENENDKK